MVFKFSRASDVDLQAKVTSRGTPITVMKQLQTQTHQKFDHENEGQDVFFTDLAFL